MEHFNVPRGAQVIENPAPPNGDPAKDDSRAREVECTAKIGALLKEYRCALIAPIVYEKGPDGWIRGKAPEIKVVAEK